MAPTTQTQLFPPPTDSTAVDEKRRFALPARQWLFSIQNLLPLITVDTSGGNFAQDTPPAGLSGSTGQSNQNMEITYKKVSADGNTFTLNGVSDGVQTLTAQNAFFKIKSDGTSWWVTG